MLEITESALVITSSLLQEEKTTTISLSILDEVPHASLLSFVEKVT